ncbi:MAG: DUF2905 domain-containing protein [Chloroherpetonaceae bacterium]|nr:DUF2905 domain-containing protein [Chloroherpetonaceae bacterium]MCS7210230.1 DUF2905 domain-containing protein [Chloroherpetonaceae bacterium]MDW8019158.1 DUF2905 domain-containing protein [Chloroherpetonaceae bacterium]
MSELGKVLILLGAFLLLLGVLFYFVPKVPLFEWLGRLPLDFKIERENFTFYFPLGTSILLSILLSALLYLARKIFS